MKRLTSLIGLVVFMTFAFVAGPLSAAEQKPNIVVIFGDDIGTWNRQRVLARHDGANAEHRPHRQGRHDLHGSLRPAELHGGPCCVHHGATPRSHGHDDHWHTRLHAGIQKVDPTLAEVLKAQDYATAQFGKNHLGDRNEFLPTVHGFDEWFGNLYHLNAEEEPEELDYPGQKIRNT